MKILILIINLIYFYFVLFILKEKKIFLYGYKKIIHKFHMFITLFIIY